MFELYTKLCRIYYKDSEKNIFRPFLCFSQFPFPLVSLVDMSQFGTMLGLSLAHKNILFYLFNIQKAGIR